MCLLTRTRVMDGDGNIVQYSKLTVPRKGGGVRSTCHRAYSSKEQQKHGVTESKTIKGYQAHPCSFIFSW